ncbi:unnamed protein product [Diabrotica balteata]|uniref:Uncharacterized protein n=1 Tax=Diabrotica balteata TaxID=107213 RepID=A0A9N9T5I3_DIABA|nr:unnamed protein product [Diabrotica balteata]
MLKKVKLLGHMYTFTTPTFDSLPNLQYNLEKLNYKDLRKLMGWLTPSCKEILFKCLWANKAVNCTEYFKAMVTFQGYCCLFNYLKITSNATEMTDLKLSKKVLYQKTIGARNGLTVVIRNNIDDYFFNNIPTFGANVYIFEANNYPDASTGSTGSVMVENGTETFVDVVPKIVRANKAIMKYSEKARSCIFSKERVGVFGDSSSGDCLVGCKAEKMKKLCHCVPFQIPLKSSLVCNLMDLNCLSRHKGKSMSIVYNRFLLVLVLKI